MRRTCTGTSSGSLGVDLKRVGPRALRATIASASGALVGLKAAFSSSCSQTSLRVGKDGIACRSAVERHLADDRDRRGVQEVGDLGAGDRAADDDAPLASTTQRVVPGALRP